MANLSPEAAAKRQQTTNAWRLKQTELAIAATGKVFCPYHYGYVPREEASKVRVAGGKTRWMCTACFSKRQSPRKK